MRTVGFWLLLIGLLNGAGAQVPYPLAPDWRSADRFYATGRVFADINNDGWLDFVVSNGNDMFGQEGALPSDLDRNGRVDDSDLLLLLFHFGRGCD